EPPEQPQGIAGLDHRRPDAEQPAADAVEDVRGAHRLLARQGLEAAGDPLRREPGLDLLLPEEPERRQILTVVQLQPGLDGSADLEGLGVEAPVHLEPEEARRRQESADPQNGGGHHRGIEEEAAGEQQQKNGEEGQGQEPEERLAPAEAADLGGRRNRRTRGAHAMAERPAASGPASMRGAATRPTAWSTIWGMERRESRPSAPRMTR